MEVLVIEFESIYANKLGQLLQWRGCHVQVAIDAPDALRLLRAFRFDVILMGARVRASAARAILHELYTRVPRHLNTSRLCMMANSPSSVMLQEVRGRGAIECVPSNTESILSIARKTPRRDVVIVAGLVAPCGLKPTLMREGYAAAIVHDLDSAVRVYFHGTYNVVFLETRFPVLTDPDHFGVVHRITAANMACLANAQPDTYLRCILKPHRDCQVSQLLTELREDAGEFRHLIVSGNPDGNQELVAAER